MEMIRGTKSDCGLFSTLENGIIGTRIMVIAYTIGTVRCRYNVHTYACTYVCMSVRNHGLKCNSLNLLVREKLSGEIGRLLSDTVPIVVTAKNF